jgi:hypothetical protein
VVSRADLDDMEKRKFLTLPGLNSPLNVQLIASHYTNRAIPAILKKQYFDAAAK